VLGQTAGPSASHSTGTSGAWLPSEAASDPSLRHLNFYDAAVVELVEQRLQTKGWGGIVTEDRLLRSLLSSQPVCFNLFGVLARHPDVLLAWVQSLGIDAVAIEPTEQDDPALVRIEYAAPKTTHLGSSSAFDACITYRDSAGSRGVVAVETKYAENLADQSITSDPKYAAATAELGHWKDGAAEVLNRPAPVQCWQNLLLVQKAVQLRTQGWEHGTFVMVADGRDLGALSATAALAAQLHYPGSWVRWSPYQDLVAQARGHEPAADWAQWFNTRYLDLSPIEQLRLPDPNCSDHVVDQRGDVAAIARARTAAHQALIYADRVFLGGSYFQSVGDADLSGASTLHLIAMAHHLEALRAQIHVARMVASNVMLESESFSRRSKHIGFLDPGTS